MADTKRKQSAARQGDAVINPIVRVLNSTAIDKTARMVTSQRGCEAEYADLSRAELVELLKRLNRKQRLIHSALGLKTKKQSENLRARIRSGYCTKKFDGRLAVEFVRIGDNIHAVCSRIAEMTKASVFTKEERKKMGLMQNQWRAEHPGCIWDGRHLVAPNGAIFSPWVAAQSLETH